MKFIILFLLISCSSTPKETDINTSWAGKNLTQLETHKYYSTLPILNKEISEKEQLINLYEERMRRVGNQSCFGAGTAFGGGFGRGPRLGLGATFCDEDEFIKDNCVHQFLITNNIITNFSLIGDNCSLNCKHLYSGKCE